jgi:hypothetical protein
MIRPLRKYHFFIWHLQALVLPVVFVTAFIVRPSLPDVEASAKDTFYAERKTLSDSTSMIVISVNKPLTVPSCLIFHVTRTKETLLGKLDHQGMYEFIIQSPESTVTLKLIDPIHQQMITSIKLNDN